MYKYPSTWSARLRHFIKCNPVGTNLHNHVMSDKLRTWIRGYTGSCVSFYSGFCRSEPTKLTWVYGKLCQFVKHSSVGTDLQD